MYKSSKNFEVFEILFRACLIYLYFCSCSNLDEKLVGLSVNTTRIRFIEIKTLNLLWRYLSLIYEILKCFELLKIK